MILKSHKTSVVDSELENGLAIAQAEYLRANLYVANVGTTSVILLLSYFFWGEDLAQDLLVWVAGGAH